VFIDDGGFVLVEQSTDPIEEAARLRGQTNFLRPGLVVEQVVTGHQDARVAAVIRGIERKVRVQVRQVAAGLVDVMTI